MDLLVPSLSSDLIYLFIYFFVRGPYKQGI